MNPKWLAEYCGTSVAMIERRYGRFLAAGADHQLALLAGGEVAARRWATNSAHPSKGERNSSLNGLPTY